MAVKNTKTGKNATVDYGRLERELKNGPPARVYMLYGEEDYLRDKYLLQLRALCVPEGIESFNYHRLNGPSLDLGSLSAALESVPFMGERTLVEVHDFDINKTSAYDPKRFADMIQDVPDWCTLAFVFPPDYSPDGRLGPVKTLKKCGVDARFTTQDSGAMERWIITGFRKYGKNCDNATASYLMFVCGSGMKALIPQIIKVADYTEDTTVTQKQIDEIADRLPQTRVFDMTDALGNRQYDKASAQLADLLADREQTPGGILYWISEQFRRLYAAFLALESGEGELLLTDCVPDLARNSFLIPKLMASARRFSSARLARAVSLCADCTFSLRDASGATEEETLKELLFRLAMDKNDA